MRGRCKAAPKPLTGRALWRLGETYQHRGVRVTCVEDAEGKHRWRTAGDNRVHLSADAALDHVEHRG